MVACFPDLSWGVVVVRGNPRGQACASGWSEGKKRGLLRLLTCRGEEPHLGFRFPGLTEMVLQGAQASAGARKGHPGTHLPHHPLSLEL